MGSIISLSYFNEPVHETCVIQAKTENSSVCDLDQELNKDVGESSDQTSALYKMEFPDTEDMKLSLKIDATETSVQIRRSPMNSQITPETVRVIESELAFYEKVSLVFLLYDNEDIALEWILKESSNIVCLDQTVNLVYEWALTQAKKSGNNIWKSKFLEALCIIQNYHMLRRLGYNKKDLQSLFLPSNTATALHVSLQRKALYFICENLGNKNTKIFLMLLENAFRQRSMHFEKFNDFLELYFLHCLSMKFVTKTDFSNFITIFKQMELHNICDLLQYITNSRTGDFVTDETSFEESNRKTIREELVETENPLHFDLNGTVHNVNKQHAVSPSHSHISAASNLSTRSIYSEDDLYPIDPENVGICVIINQEEFKMTEDTKIPKYLRAKKKLQNRTGTLHDRDKLSTTFRKLGFKIKITENRNHLEMVQDIKDAVDKFSTKYSCFVLCILSHGEEGIVFGSDCVQVGVDRIENILYGSTNLLGKPKVLIMQSCQGTNLQKAVSRTEVLSTDGPEPLASAIVIKSDKLIPSRSDMLICWSTIPGYASIRNKYEGSWYIQELCDAILRDCYKTHLADILITVTNKVRQKIIKTKDGTLCVVPKCDNTQSKRIFLQILDESLEPAPFVDDK